MPLGLGEVLLWVSGRTWIHTPECSHSCITCFSVSFRVEMNYSESFWDEMSYK